MNVVKKNKHTHNMVTKNIEFIPDTRQVFDGLYESALYNSDMEYNYNEEREEGEPERELNFDKFKEQLGEGITDLISDLIVNEDNFVTRCEFVEISSPRCYNYGTDKLVIDMDVDLDRIKEWSLTESVKEEFGKYLKEKDTSYDGYCSFVRNDVEGYYEESFDRYPSVVVEFYLLTKIYGSNEVVKGAKRGAETEYELGKYEVANDAFYENMEPVKTSED